MRKPVLHASALLAATTLGLSGCVFASTPEPSPPAPPEIDPDDLELDLDDPPEVGDGETVDITGSFEYDDGLVVELSDFRRGTSSTSAIPSTEPYIALRLHVENNTGADIDTTLTGISCTIGEFGQDTDTVVDFQQDIENEISGTLQDGDRISGGYACVMMDHEDYLEIEVDVNDVGTREPVFFSGYVD
ncbi:hypothetical protein J4H86_22715 [Spiractinospora alimapuensis]|uniref:hypothetical protein n=1 Tax=Spiractinospora alimapuensis TaxID=2820884 RepID=UPI001F1D44C4|nr:hypothetical protein [Spiractinospora alimapuensis]QVQ51569.1 hypothetical protein J4H86_22715 [Spiractinospora alimapuensis]